MDGIRITRLRITNYRGVKAVDAKVGPAGLVVRGENAAGKTSVLRAIRAALLAQDVSPDAIRQGADEAEILVEMDAATVARTIDKDGPHLNVKAAGKDQRAPQRWLNELVGSSPIDPIEFYRQKPKERLKTLLEAIPLKADTPALIAAIPAAFRTDLPAIASDDHALVACAKLTTHFFDRRTEENRIVRAQEAILASRPVGFSVPPDPRPALAATQGKVAEIRALATRAERSRGAREKTVARIAELRDLAAGAEAKAAAVAIHESVTLEDRLEAQLKKRDEQAGELTCLRGDFDACSAKVMSLRDQLRAAEAEAEAVHAKVTARTGELAARDQMTQSLRRQIETRDTETERAGAARAQAEELERTLAETDPAPEPGALEAAEKAVKDLSARAGDYLAATAEQEKYLAAEKLVQAGQTIYAELTKLVDRYREELPRALLKASCTIKGLSVEGERILLDGVDIEAACGRERMELAVEIARRANVKSRILIVDGLEVIDPEHFVDFVKMATRDGYQLLGTRVDAGDMVLEALEVAP